MGGQFALSMATLKLEFVGALAKMAINGGRESSRATGLSLEALAQSVLYDDEEKYERMTAFLEKRAARQATRKNGDQGDNNG